MPRTMKAAVFAAKSRIEEACDILARRRGAPATAIAP